MSAVPDAHRSARREPEPGLVDACPPWVDSRGALRELGGDLQVYQEICALFLEEHHAWQGALPAQELADREAFLATVHEIANSLAIVGAVGLSQALRREEFRLRDDPQPLVPPLHDWLLARLDEVAGELRALVTLPSTGR